MASVSSVEVNACVTDHRTDVLGQVLLIWRRVAVLEDVAAVLVDVPQARVQLASIDGQTMLSGVIWKVELKDGFHVAASDNPADNGIIHG